jgi:hypothetical protein
MLETPRQPGVFNGLAMTIDRVSGTDCRPELPLAAGQAAQLA